MRFHCVLFSLCLIIPISTRSAEGLKTLPDSAAAMGKVGARFATLKDPSVTRTNPASLADLDGSHFQFNFQLWHGETEFTQAGTGAKDQMIDPWKPLGSIYLTHQINDTLTLGLGVGTPFGVSISWPQDGALRYAVPYETTMKNVAINPALGLRINDRVSIGAGLEITKSSLRIKQAYSWFAATGFPFPDGNVEYDAEGWGLGAYGAVNFEINETQRLSLIARLPTSIDYEGDFTVSNLPAPLAPLFAERTDFESEMEFPGSISLGYGIDLSDRTTLGFDFDWTMNSSHDDLPLDIGGNQPLLGGTTAIPLDWKDAYSIGTGISSRVTDSLTLRGGYLHSQSPMSDGTYTPAIPANDRHIFSLGFGYEFGDNVIDFGYSYIHLEDRDVTNNIQPLVNGYYDPEWHIMTLSFTRKF